MILEHYLIAEVNETNVYVLGCEETKRAAIFDAGGFDPALCAFVNENGLEVEKIFITHGHYDHVDGLEKYRKAFPGAQVLYAGASLSGAGSVEQVRDGDAISVGNLQGKALAIPGHTGDSMAFYFEEKEADKPAASVLFCGDILFAGSVGGCSGDNREMELRGIREKIFTLPGDTMVFPGHGPASTVAVEEAGNPFLQ
ncbi:MAG: hydroxyacylglutathione hydrolase family protein [Candidatus Sumerlaeia bacterium]